jgi:P27 family predicted phage terminase small subunit
MLLELHGNPGHRKKQSEPVPTGALADDAPPAWLSAEQREAWKYALDHAPPALLRRIDRGVLTGWVVVEDLLRRASEAVNQGGLMARVSDVTLAVPAPAVGIVLKATAAMARLASELGFSPAARARVYAGSQPRPEPPVVRAGGKRRDNDPIPLAEYLAEGERMRAELNAELGKKH